MSHYKPYPAYKDSGVDWLRQVPEHWSVSSVKWEFDPQLGKMLQPEKKAAADVQVPYHKAVSVQWEKVADEAPEIMWATTTEIETYRLRKGDLLVCEGGDVGRSAVFDGDDAEPVIIQNSVHRVRPKNGNLNAYLLRLLQSCRASGWFEVLCSKATIVHFTAEKLGDLEFPVAPVEEQIAIAAHLDRETARIDALVAKKTRFIELLREKRQALITHAVTKGLDPNVKMKDSGVECLGEVPEHWGVGVVSRVATRTVVGIAEAATHAYADSGTPILRSTNIRPYRISGEILYVNADFADERDTKLIHARDLVTVRTGNAGVTAVVPPELDGCQCFTMLITTLKDGMQSDYYCYWMNSAAAIHYFSIEGWGTAQVNISVPILKSLPVPIPSEQEQKEIVAFLLRETQRLDMLLTKTERSIDLLKERRSALITAAVTGQIDLREAV